MYSFSFSNLCRWWHSMDLCQLEILVQPQTSVHQIRFGTKWPGFQLHRLQNGKGIIEFNSISTQTFKNRNRFNEILGFWRFIRRFKKGNQELHSTWPERRLLLNLHKKSQIRSSFYGFPKNPDIKLWSKYIQMMIKSWPFQNIQTKENLKSFTSVYFIFYKKYISPIRDMYNPN